MVIVKLKNVSVYNAGKFRPNQNYTTSVHLDKPCTIEDVRRELTKQSSKVLLSKNSIINIV